MLQELQAMRRELVALREEVAQLRALPAPEKPPERPQEPRKDDTLSDDTHSELRGLVAALRRQE